MNQRRAARRQRVRHGRHQHLTPTGDLESRQIPQILPIHVSSTKHVDDTVHHGRGMALAWYRDVPCALEFLPLERLQVKHPDVVVVVAAVRAAEAKSRAREKSRKSHAS